MKKLLLVSLCFVLFCATSVFAQNRTVTGTVTAKDDGLPLPGVTVKVKGTSIGTQTGANGKFVLSAPANGVLQFSFIGYVAVEKAISGNAVNVSLETQSQTLGEVIVTGALNRKFEAKSAGFASTHLTATEANQSAPVNILQGLTAKVAGLNVTQTGTGVDAGIKVQLRGARSIANNNQALIVVDGTPLPSGDISSIDPNTIETYDVQPGSSGAVLYGSEASNGVIIITTKKGSANGKPTIIYSNSLQLSQAAYYPKFQKQYGAYGGETIGQGGVDPVTGNTLLVPYENELYGPAFDGRTYQVGAPAGSATGPVLLQTYSARKTDPIQDFYRTGVIEQNSLSVGSGNADDYFNITALNLFNNGITPSEYNRRNSVSVKGGKKYGIFKAEYNLTYSNVSIHQVGSDYQSSAQNVNYGVNQFPANMNIKDFMDPTSTFANPNDYYSAYSTNPYWSVNNSSVNTTRNIFNGNLQLTLTPTKFLDVMYKLTDSQGTQDVKTTKAEVDFSAYAISDPLGGGNRPSGFKATGVALGQEKDQIYLGDGAGGNGRIQNDLIFNFHPKNLFNDFKTNILIGSTYYSLKYKTTSVSSNSLLVNGLYNINYISGVPSVDESQRTINQLSFYGTANFSYKDYLFVEAQLRNEQDSRLRPAAQSYWYPGVNGSFVFTEAIPALKNNKILSFGRLRASYGITAQIGVGPYQINDVYGVTTTGFPYGGLGGLSLGTAHYTPLVPERNTEIEGGIELGFFDNRIHGTFTYYKQNDKNQTLNLGVSPSTGYSTIVSNVGEMQSSGFEASLDLKVLTKNKNKVGLDIGLKLTDQESKVVSLLNGVPEFLVAGNQYATVGLPFPYVKATDFQRDPQGRVVVSATTGLPLQNTVSQSYLGRTSPEWMFDPNIAVSYKFMTLNVVAEYRTGFVDYFSSGTTYLFTGSSELSVQNGRQRFIYPNSVINTGTTAAPVYVPNTTVSTNDGNWNFWVNSTQNTTPANFVTSGAYWKIREASLTFDLTQFTKSVKFAKTVRLSLTGRNLLMWVPKTNWWGDPDVSGGSTNDNQGTVTSINSVPSQRIFGAKLDVTF